MTFSSSRRRVRLNGIFLLDKPIGISSNAALQRVKNIFQAMKAGHTGSLDPLATGMLPICFGDATKYSQYLLDSDKTYAVTMQLGVRTTTSDAEGEVVSTREVPHFSLADIDRAFDAFRGRSQQIPSMFSALKHNGVPLYEYARKGVTIDRPSRPITIYQLTVLSIKEHFVEFTVKCSKGTYVRTLVDDVGEVLGCGAHVTALRRTSVGPYLESQMMTIEKLNAVIAEDNTVLKSLLLPVDTAIQHWPIISVTEEMTVALKQGKSMMIPNAPTSGWMRFADPDGVFFGVGEAVADGMVAPRRLIHL